MSEYICKFCKKEFLVASKLKKHQKSVACNIIIDEQQSSEKVILDNIVDEQQPTEKVIPATLSTDKSCHLCGKTYKHKSSLCRHVSTCEKRISNELLNNENVKQMIINLNQKINKNINILKNLQKSLINSNSLIQSE